MSQEPSASILVQQPQQQKRSASADVPSATSRGTAVPPKKRARNQQQQPLQHPAHDEAEEPDADAAEAGGAAPLDLSAPGRGRSREPEPELPPNHQTPPTDASSPNVAAAAAAASTSAYMSRCAETLRTMILAAPEDTADCWLARGHWQASLHAQYLYYSSLALSGLLPPHPPPPPPHPLASQAPPHSTAISSSKTPQSSMPLMSPSFSGLFAPPSIPPPPATTLPTPQSLPPLMSHSQSLRSAHEEPHSPARRLPTPQSPSISHQSLSISQHQHQQQQRKVKASRAMPSAAGHASATVAVAAAAAAIPRTSSSSLPTPERQSSGETDLQCSCGRAFASLIGLTLHLKETGHGPCSNSRDRDIPKLVRGQDMWINSETEQTREILRCIRCKQSFRTLPELTMHMIKTRHYTEIIYTDTAPPSQQSGGASAASARVLPGLSSAKEPGASKERLLQAVGQHQQQQRSGRAEVKEADSATDPSQLQNPAGATSTLQKMQHFVEASLPRSALRRPAMFQEVLQSSVFDSGDRGIDSDNEDEPQRDDVPGCRGHKGTSNGDLVNYLSPDRPPEPKENPLSSLQKLVDTAEKTSVAGPANLTVATSASGAAASVISAPPSSASTIAGARVSGIRDGSTPTEGLSGTTPAAASASVSASPGGTGGANRGHTVIMLSPTYIYQGGMYPSPFSVCHPSAALLAGPGPVDFSKLPPTPQPPTQTKQRSEEAASTPKKSGAITAAAAASAAAAAIASCSTAVGEPTEKPGGIGGSWPESLMQKKAKCHFCSKPFANKGQVRLHVSKGKCPSLLARLPTAALPPFPFFPAIEYIKAAGRFHAAAPPTGSGKELQA